MTLTLPLYELCIDWDADDDYSGAGEAVTCHLSPGSVTWERGTGGLSIGLIAGIAAGTAAVAMTFGGLIMWLIMRRGRGGQPPQPPPRGTGGQTPPRSDSGQPTQRER